MKTSMKTMTPHVNRLLIKNKSSLILFVYKLQNLGSKFLIIPGFAVN